MIHIKHLAHYLMHEKGSDALSTLINKRNVMSKDMGKDVAVYGLAEGLSDTAKLHTA